MTYRIITNRAILTFCLVFYAVFYSHAQTILDPPITISEFLPEDTCTTKASLIRMFQGLEKDRIPTGLLLDYAIELVDIKRYSGESLVDSNLVNIATYENILRTVRSSTVETFPPFQIAEIKNNLSQAASSSVVPVSALVYQYNYIREDALTNNLINLNLNPTQINDKYLRRIGGLEWVNPYATDTVFAFSPICNIYTDNSVTFQFPQNVFLANLSTVSYEFDPDDGGGFRTISVGSSLQTSYSSDGYKNLRMRVTLTDNRVLLAHSPMFLILNDGNNFVPHNAPSNPIIIDDTFSVTKNIDSKIIRATVSIKYSNTNLSNTIRKPFILSEGFDPAILNQFSPYYLSNQYGEKGFNNIDTFYNSIYYSALKNQYDIIYVDWHNSEADIRDNADLLIEIIEEVNRRKAPTAYSSILMGQSMGGLIARYALCKMEQEGLLHDVTTYISHDTPHLGANVPLSILYLIEELNSLASYTLIRNAICTALSPMLGKTPQELLTLYLDALDVYFSTSVSQMLINNVNNRGAIHNQFMSEMQSIGFPSGDPELSIKNICITNGDSSPLAYGTTIADASASLSQGWVLSVVETLIASFVTSFQIFIMPNELTRYQFLRCLIGEGSYNLQYLLYPLNGSRTDRLVYHQYVQYTKKFLWLFNLSPETIFETKHYATATDILTDGARGSYYTLDSSSIIGLSPYVSSTDNRFEFSVDFQNTSAWPSFNLTGSFIKKILFIPTASSVCYNNGIVSNYDFQRSLSSSNVNSTNTPFDEVIFTKDILSNSTNHIYLNHVIMDNVMNHVLVLDENRFRHEYIGEITGQNFPVTGDHYYVTGEEPYTSVTWAVSDSTIASIDNTGIITVTGIGSVTIYANVIYQNDITVLSKDIMVGFPPIRLDVVRNIYSTTQGVYAVPNDTSANMTLLRDSSVVYHWGVYTPSYNPSEVVWSSSNLDYTLIDVDRTGMVVYLYLTNGNYTSQTYSLNLIYYLPELFPLDPPIPIINGEGAIFVEGDDGEEEIIVKSESTEPVLSYLVDGRILVNFNKVPSPAHFIRRLLEEDEFSALLKTIKPWGNKDFLIIPVIISINGTDTTYNATLKFLFKQDFPNE